MINISKLFTSQEVEKLCSYFNAEVITFERGIIVAKTSTAIVKRIPLSEVSSYKSLCHKKGRKTSSQVVYIGYLTPIADFKYGWKKNLLQFNSVKEANSFVRGLIAGGCEMFIQGTNRGEILTFLEETRIKAAQQEAARKATKEWQRFLSENL